MDTLTRRELLRSAGIAGIAAASSLALPRVGYATDTSFLTTGLPDGVYGVAELDSLAGKKPLIKLSYRPPNYETPVGYFGTTFTPNEAFFVRYHHAGIPESLDPKAWRLKIGGEAAATPLELGLDDLRRNFEPVEIAAVCQCSGNRRGLSDPHVPGVQWGLGAMGNALWKGARFRDLLAKAGLRKDALEIVLAGADEPVLDKTPAFVKSIPIWKALDENTIIAYEMNGQPLPHFNGFPARLVVPGWTATYWIKHIVRVEAVTKPFEGFWMKSAYRIPTGKFPVIDRFTSQETPANTPITEMVVNSLIASPAEGAQVSAGKPVEVTGIAWDGGYGITRVEASTDGGQSWAEAELGKDYGRFSFRPWSFRFTPQARGSATATVKASNRTGQTQTESLIFNPAGYHNNVIRPLHLTVA